jgi:hypothetical protein
LYQSLVADTRFHRLLLTLDQDCAGVCRNGRCPVCGGVLHAAHFARKPRGLPSGATEYDRRRFSFCCAEPECRKRTTPPSLRFLGRKVYLATVVTVVSALQRGSLTAQRQLAARLGISPRTVVRWRRWWREIFTSGPFWTQAAAAFMPPVDRAGLPASLLDRFGDPDADAPDHRLRLLLRFLAPITGGCRPGHVF